MRAFVWRGWVEDMGVSKWCLVFSKAQEWETELRIWVESCRGLVIGMHVDLYLYVGNLQWNLGSFTPPEDL